MSIFLVNLLLVCKFLTKIVGMEPYKCEPKRKSVEPQVSSRAGSNVWCYCDQCHCEERWPICAVKKLPFLAVKSLQ